MASEKKRRQITLLHIYTNWLRQRDGYTSACGIFLDFTKTFDYQILLKKKLEHYIIREKVHDVVNSFPTNRFQSIMDNNEQVYSNFCYWSARSKYLIGPFLFLVYINDLPNSCNFDMILCDSVIICNDKNIKNLKITSKKEFLKVENWLQLNKITLNYKKATAFWSLTTVPKTLTNDFWIKTTIGTIDENNTVKYLGVIIECKITWESHVQYSGSHQCREVYVARFQSYKISKL